jgi:tRNA(Ile)-lysidine synthase
MFEAIQKYIEKYQMIDKDDTIIIGVSGGADSMALLMALINMKEKYCMTLVAAHVNHGLRGAAAAGDQALVEKTCKKYGIVCESKQMNIKELAEQKRLTIEEAGRDARYDFFYHLQEKHKAQKIAVAHHQNDQAETVLHHFIRGTGMKGLSGMQPVREDGLIRPLLAVTRQQIEQYCETNNIAYRTDASNNTIEYTRNSLRLALIPEIEGEYNPNFTQNICQMASLLAEENAFLEKLTQAAYDSVANVVGDNVELDLNAMNAMVLTLKRRVIRKSIHTIKGNITNIEGKHIEMVVDIIACGRTGAEVQLPEKIRAIRDNKKVIILQEMDEYINPYHQTVVIPGVTPLPMIQRQMVSRFVLREEMVFEPNRAYIDADQLEGSLSVRNRRDGDRFVPFGMSGSKKVKDIFIDAHIPKRARKNHPLLCDGDDIVWIMGIRTAEKYKIKNNSINIIEFLIEIVDNL